MHPLFKTTLVFLLNSRAAFLEEKLKVEIKNGEFNSKREAEEDITVVNGREAKDKEEKELRQEGPAKKKELLDLTGHEFPVEHEEKMPFFAVPFDQKEMALEGDQHSQEEELAASDDDEEEKHSDGLVNMSDEEEQVRKIMEENNTEDLISAVFGGKKQFESFKDFLRPPLDLEKIKERGQILQEILNGELEFLEEFGKILNEAEAVTKKAMEHTLCGVKTKGHGKLRVVRVHKNRFNLLKSVQVDYESEDFEIFVTLPEQRGESPEDFVYYTDHQKKALNCFKADEALWDATFLLRSSSPSFHLRPRVSFVVSYLGLVAYCKVKQFKKDEDMRTQGLGKSEEEMLYDQQSKKSLESVGKLLSMKEYFLRKKAPQKKGMKLSEKPEEKFSFYFPLSTELWLSNEPDLLDRLVGKPVNEETEFLYIDNYFYLTPPFIPESEEDELILEKRLRRELLEEIDHPLFVEAGHEQNVQNHDGMTKEVVVSTKKHLNRECFHQISLLLKGNLSFIGSSKTLSRIIHDHGANFSLVGFVFEEVSESYIKSEIFIQMVARSARKIYSGFLADSLSEVFQKSLSGSQSSQSKSIENHQKELETIAVDGFCFIANSIFTNKSGFYSKEAVIQQIQNDYGLKLGLGEFDSPYFTLFAFLQAFSQQVHVAIDFSQLISDQKNSERARTKARVKSYHVKEIKTHKRLFDFRVFSAAGLAGREMEYLRENKLEHANFAFQLKVLMEGLVGSLASQNQLQEELVTQLLWQKESPLCCTSDSPSQDCFLYTEALLARESYLRVENSEDIDMIEREMSKFYRATLLAFNHNYELVGFTASSYKVSLLFLESLGVLGKFEEAAQVYDKSIERAEHFFTLDHPFIIGLALKMGKIFTKNKMLLEATMLYKAASVQIQKLYGKASQNHGGITFLFVNSPFGNRGDVQTGEDTPFFEKQTRGLRLPHGVI